MPHRPRFPQRGFSPFRPAMQAFFRAKGIKVVSACTRSRCHA